MPFSSAVSAPVAGAIDSREAPAPAAAERPSGAVRRFWVVGVVFACVMGAVFVLGATSRGVGLSPDSVQYLSVAESALEGRGLVTYAWEGEPLPLTHFPPAYPLTLAAGAQVGSSEAFARWFNAVLFVLSIVVAVVITRRLAPDSAWPALIVAALYGTAFDMVAAHSMAWTEPLYLTLTLGGLLALARAIERGAVRPLIAASILAAIAATVRYIGVANVGALGLAVLLWWPTAFWRRVGTAIGAGLIAIAPLLIAVVAAGPQSSAEEVAGAVGNRQLGWHPLAAADLRMLASTVAKWASPLNDASYLTAVWLLGVAVLLGIVVVAYRRSGRPRVGTRRLAQVRVMPLYVAVYFAVLALSMTIADAQTEFDFRLLLPVLAIAIILGVVWLEEASAGGGDRRVRLVARTLVALVIVAGLIRIVPWLADARSRGLGLRRLEASDSELVAATLALPGSARVYSNRPYFLRVQAARMVHGLPRARDPNSLLPNPRYAEQVRAICDSAAAFATYVVMFPDAASEDATANGSVATTSGDASAVAGGRVIKVRPGCKT